MLHTFDDTKKDAPANQGVVSGSVMFLEADLLHILTGGWSDWRI